MDVTSAKSWTRSRVTITRNNGDIAVKLPFASFSESLVRRNLRNAKFDHFDAQWHAPSATAAQIDLLIRDLKLQLLAPVLVTVKTKTGTVTPTPFSTSVESSVSTGWDIEEYVA